MDTPTFITVDKEHQMQNGVVYQCYQFDQDPNEAVMAYLRAFHTLPDTVYIIRKMAFIAEPKGE